MKTKKHALPVRTQPTRQVMTRRRWRSLFPLGLPYSHMSFQAISKLYGAELIQSPQHDNRARFSIRAVPSPETRPDLGRKGQRSRRMRVLLPFRPALKGNRYRFQGLPVGRGNPILKRPLALAITILNQLQTGHTSHQCHRTEIPERCRRHQYPLNVKTLCLDRPEQRLNDPTSTGEAKDPPGLVTTLMPIRGCERIHFWR